MFIGTVVDQESIGDRGYRSVIKLERFIRHNSTFLQNTHLTTTCPGKKSTSTGSSVAQRVSYPVASSGELTVFSSCNLRLMHRYFVSANLRSGLKNKGRLTVACAQEDVEYSLYVLQKLLEGPQCCQY